MAADDLSEIKRSHDKRELKNILNQEISDIESNVQRINSLRSKREDLANQITSIDKQLPSLQQQISKEESKAQRFLRNNTDQFTSKLQAQRSNEMISNRANQFNTLVERRNTNIDEIKRLEDIERQELQAYQENRKLFNAAKNRLNDLYKLDAFNSARAQRERAQAPSIKDAGLTEVRLTKVNDKYEITKRTFEGDGFTIVQEREVRRVPVDEPQSVLSTIPSSNFQPKNKLDQLNNIDLPISENQQTNQRQTITQAQLAERGKPVEGASLTFSFSAPKENEINLNPTRFVIAPYELGYKVGDYLADNVKGEKSIREDLGAITTKVKQDPLGTANAVITGTLEAAAKDPFGFIGEGVALGGVGKIAASPLKKLRPSKVLDETPTNIQTIASDNRIKTISSGAFKIEEGLIRRTKKDFNFESTGNLRRVEASPDFKTSVNDFRQISNTPTPLLSNRAQITNFKEFSREVTEFKPINRQATSKSFEATTPSREIFRGEIETKIFDTNRNLVQTQKVPAELIREGSSQRLFVDGREFNIKSEVIDTPKAIETNDLFTRETGLFDLDPKQQTQRTITTDVQTGARRESLTQISQKPVDLKFVFPDDAGLKEIGFKEVNLLTSKPSQEVKFDFPKSSRALADPITKSRSSRGRGPAKEVDFFKDLKISEGVSLNLKDDPFNIKNAPAANIVEGQVTGERLSPKQLEFELTQQRNAALESAAAREERVVADVFGKDFVEQAKSTKRIDLGDPFKNDVFKNSPFDDVQVFKEQRSQSRTTDLSSSSSQAPSSRSNSQQSIFVDQKLENKIKDLDLKSPSIDASVAADFSKLSPKSSFRFGPNLGFADSSIFKSDVSQSFGPSQDTRQGQLPAQEPQFKEILSPFQESITESAFRFDEAFKFDTPPAPKQTNENVFDEVVPITPPGFPDPTIRPRPRSNNNDNFVDPLFDDPRRRGKRKGQFAGSLTGLALGLETKNDLKNLTGLEIRPIKFGRRF